MPRTSASSGWLIALATTTTRSLTHFQISAWTSKVVNSSWVNPNGVILSSSSLKSLMSRNISNTIGLSWGTQKLQLVSRESWKVKCFRWMIKANCLGSSPLAITTRFCITLSSLRIPAASRLSMCPRLACRGVSDLSSGKRTAALTSAGNS